MPGLIKIKSGGLATDAVIKYRKDGAAVDVSLPGGETHPDIENFDVLNYSDFNDNTLGAYDLNQWKEDWNNTGTPWSGLSKLQIVDQEGRKCLRHNYLNGQFGASGGGANFNGIISNSSGLTEIYFSYRVFFELGFDWGLGGKMSGVRNVPGPSGGTGLDYEDTDGFSARLMWNPDGTIRFYNYHHDMGAVYGDNMGLVNWGQLIPGQWHTITQRYVMNTVGSINGICQAWLDGELVATAQNMEFRRAPSPQSITEMYICTFMGGNDSGWAPDHDQFILTDDFYVWKYSAQYLTSNPGVPRGLQVFDSEDALITPLD